MKRWQLTSALGLGLILAVVLRAGATEDLPAQVLTRLSRGDAEQARELLREGEGRLPARTQALLVFACEVAAAPSSTAALSSRAAELAAVADPEDVRLLRAMQTVLGPRGAYFDAVLDASYAAVERAPRERLLELSATGDDRTRQLAVASIASWLAPLRAKVTAGGALEPTERAALQEVSLIEALIARLPERATALDRMPPELAVEVPRSATAFHALVLIEEPALAGLHAAYPAPGTEESIAAINSAIDLRQRRFPGSSWDDARPKR